MSADDTAGGPQRAVSGLDEDSWTSARDLSDSPSYSARSARRTVRAPRPVQRPSLDDALRAMLQDCPTSPRLEELIRALEAGDEELKPE